MPLKWCQASGNFDHLANARANASSSEEPLQPKLKHIWRQACPVERHRSSHVDERGRGEFCLSSYIGLGRPACAFLRWHSHMCEAHFSWTHIQTIPLKTGQTDQSFMVQHDKKSRTTNSSFSYWSLLIPTWSHLLSFSLHPTHPFTVPTWLGRFMHNTCSLVMSGGAHSSCFCVMEIWEGEQFETIQIDKWTIKLNLEWFT